MGTAYNCKVVVVGTWSGAVSMVLSDTEGTFSNEWFDAPEPLRKEFLATALAAKSSGLDVMVSLVDHPPDEHQHGHIDEIYLS